MRLPTRLFAESRRYSESHPATGAAAPGERRGAAAVEFALVAPLLFLLILGIVEFGRLMMVQEIIINCAREGARMAALPDANESEVNQMIDTYLADAGVSGHTRTVTPSLSGVTSGQTVTVTVVVPYNSVSWLPVNTLQWMRDRQLRSAVAMRKE